MQAWFNGRTSASQAEDAGSIPVACFFGGSDMAEEFDQQVLREHDDNPLRPVKSNMVENIKLETIETYEKALALNDKDTVKRIEWELSTLTIHKKELREYIADRKAKGLTAVPNELDIAAAREAGLIKPEQQTAPEEKTEQVTENKIG